MFDDGSEYEKEIRSVVFFLGGFPFPVSQRQRGPKTSGEDGSTRSDVLTSPTCGYDLRTVVYLTLFGNRPCGASYSASLYDIECSLIYRQRDEH